MRYYRGPPIRTLKLGLPLKWRWCELGRVGTAKGYNRAVEPTTPHSFSQRRTPATRDPPLAPRGPFACRRRERPLPFVGFHRLFEELAISLAGLVRNARGDLAMLFRPNIAKGAKKAESREGRWGNPPVKRIVFGVSKQSLVNSQVFSGAADPRVTPENKSSLLQTG